MKPYLFSTLLVISFLSMSYAQQADNIDPFYGHYTLGGRGSVMSFYASTEGGGGCIIMGSDSIQYGSANSVVPNRSINLHNSGVPYSTGDFVISADGVSGNFIMNSLSDQFRDEIICCTMETAGDSVTYVCLYVQQLINGSWTAVRYPVDSLKKQTNASNNRNLIRMTSGYFDGGQNKEFAVAYNLPDSSQIIKIKIFKLDGGTGSPVRITQTQQDTMPSSLGAQAFFDISSGDYDGDGLDEIMMASNADIARSSCMPPYYAALLHFHVYDFDVINNKIVSKAVTSYKWSMCIGDPNSNTLTQMTLRSGDFNGDGKDECACGWTFVSPYHGDLLYWLQMISFSPDLMNFNFENGTSGRGVEGRTPYTAGVGWPTSNTLSLAAGDIDKDGKDELVYASIDSMFIYKFNSSLFPSKKRQFPCYSRINDPSHRTVAIVDVDGDTTFSDSSSANWYPEIITLGWTNNPVTQSTSANDNTYLHTVYKLTDPLKFTFTAKTCSNLGANIISASPGHGEGGIIPAYFAGNKITMGKPELQTIKNVVEPVVILNAPPVHFDVIGESSYDICSSYPINGSTSPSFSSQFEESSSSEVEVTTNVHSSWGVSASLSYENKFFGIGVSGSLTAKYGKDFSNTRRTDSTMTAKTSNHAAWDDLINATVTNYYVWEYPVYARGVKKGNILAVIPHPQADNWFYSNDVFNGLGNSILLDHEPGNLLSYPEYGSPEGNPDFEQSVYTGSANNISAQSSANSWELTWQTIQSQKADTTAEYGFSASASVEGFGFKVNTEGNYNRGAINTHTIEITHSIDMTANFGKINSSFTSAGYSLQPYAYWSKSGPLVLSYIVGLPASGGSFWSDNYSRKPDLTFNCYYRYFAKKGLGGIKSEMADWTKEIAVYPSTPKPGDTVTVLAAIHNYSLKATSGQVRVRFYLGNSENGGLPVSDLNGDTVFITSSPVAARSDQVLQFKWKVPGGLNSSDSILYAVIDPENNISELKEDNNKAWSQITIVNLTPVSNGANTISSFALFQNYPNPFNPVTIIRYKVANSGTVTIKVYDILGREVRTLLNEYRPAGNYKINFDAGRLSSGVYFYRMQSGSFAETKKMVILR